MHVHICHKYTSTTRYKLKLKLMKICKLMHISLSSYLFLYSIKYKYKLCLQPIFSSFTLKLSIFISGFFFRKFTEQEHFVTRVEVNPESYCKFNNKTIDRSLITTSYLGRNSVAHSFRQSNPWGQLKKFRQRYFVQLQVMKFPFSLEELDADFVGREILREPKTIEPNKMDNSLTNSRELSTYARRTSNIATFAQYNA